MLASIGVGVSHLQAGGAGSEMLLRESCIQNCWISLTNNRSIYLALKKKKKRSPNSVCWPKKKKNPFRNTKLYLLGCFSIRGQMVEGKRSLLSLCLQCSSAVPLSQGNLRQRRDEQQLLWLWVGLGPLQRTGKACGLHPQPGLQEMEAPELQLSSAQLSGTHTSSHRPLLGAGITSKQMYTL